jgi:hypothetical protein
VCSDNGAHSETVFWMNHEFLTSNDIQFGGTFNIFKVIAIICYNLIERENCLIAQNHQINERIHEKNDFCCCWCCCDDDELRSVLGWKFNGCMINVADGTRSSEPSVRLESLSVNVRTGYEHRNSNGICPSVRF